MSEKIRNLFKYDFFYGAFWIAVVVLLFLLPVAIGRQSFTEAVPTFYSYPSPSPSVKTLWQVDGGWHTTTDIPFVGARMNLVKEGIPPLWDSYSGGGEPFAGNVSGAIYYPLRFIFFFIWSGTYAFDWYFILRFFIAGLGMFLYLRAIGLRRLVALWGGIAYAFTGYFVIYLAYSFLDVDALFPWILLAIERYVRRKDIFSSAIIALLLSFTVLIGHPEPAIISCLFAAFYFLWRNIARTSRVEWGKLVGHGSLIIALVFLITLPFTLDFIASWSQGKTAEEWYGRGVANFHPMQVLHFLVSPSMMPEVAAGGHFWDRYEIIIPYIGISVLILFFLSFFIKNKPPQVAPFYAWITFAILKNAGLPILNWIGNPPLLNQIGWHKAYGPMAGVMVICGAVAFEYILREPNGGAQIAWRRFYKLIAAIPLLFIGAYIFFRSAFIEAYVPNFDFFNRNPDMVKKVAVLLDGLPEKIKEFALYVLQNHGEYFTAFLFVEAIIFAVAALVIIRYLRRKSRSAALAMVILTAFELFFYMPKIRDGFRYLDPYATTPPYIAFLQNKFAQEGTSRIFVIGDMFIARAGELYRIQKAQSAADVKPRRYFAYLPDEVDSLTGKISAEKLSEAPRKFFDAFNIKYFLSEQPLPSAPWRQLIYDNDIKIYENKDILPKAYVVFRKQTAASPEEARSAFYSSSFNPRAEAIIEDANAVVLPAATTTAMVPASVMSYQSNKVVLRSTTDRDGLLVLSEAFYPGWQAYLDGKKVATYPANVMFRGIFLPAGNHTVTFVYEPWWFWPSAIISLLTLMGILIYLFSGLGGGFSRNRNEI